MILQPPSNINKVPQNALRVFLAGSIEQDTAERWQDSTAEQLSKLGFVVFNPRRDAWDSSWSQTFEDPNFAQQVNWELDAINDADLILLYFDPKTQSPIALLELGLIAGSNPEKLAVICPEGFWRKGNVDIVCYRKNILQLNSLDEAVDLLADLQIKGIIDNAKQT